ncbi:chemotaxis protein CheR [Persicimonas caeni]|uniref:Chemotaxis protein CheR n=1 Tax=Persicimonas caeni TaxID=2292766 RepID=A0A4Y6PYQ3_PERCE|nr:CheR family methyltransferase [Persicimonas caeni]QDG53452.1 chemotaxis protein CheR [Persicimonas caeni]QED34673.1 chemotaxis protein CheR [Persicimonas caeni]
MDDRDFVYFLQWALPKMGMRWAGFRKVRGQAKKRVSRRMAELGVGSLDAYQRHLEEDESEWAVLDEMCHITISRFYRDRGVFEFLGGTVLPELAEAAKRQGRGRLRAWSAGCASGEEPYTLSLVWEFELAKRFGELELDIVATDADEHMLERARRACYPEGNLAELPEGWREEAFEPVEGEYCLGARFRERVELRLEDVRETQPDGPFDVVLCRNLAFMYFDHDTQMAVLDAIGERLVPRGALVVGAHDTLPEGYNMVPESRDMVPECHDTVSESRRSFEPWNEGRRVFRLTS